MMDGVSTMDTGSNSVLLQMNVESIAEVKVLVSNYQAEYGRSSGVQISAVTKSGTNRFRGSAYDVMRKDALERQQPDQHPQRRSQDEAEREGPRLLPSAVRSASRAATTSCSSSTRTSTRRARRAATRCGSASRPRSSAPATSRRRLDNNGNLFPFIKDPLSSSPCSAANTAGCFQSGGVVGRIPADRLYQTGLNILKLYPMPNVSGRAQLQLRAGAAGGEAARQPAGDPARLSAVAEAARHVQVTRAGRSRT